MRTFVVELGTGVDLHGRDATKATIRAVQNCFNHVSLPGLRAVAGLNSPDETEIEVIAGVPAEVAPPDTEQVAAAFPYGRVEVKVQPGGLVAPGGGPERGRHDHDCECTCGCHRAEKVIGPAQAGPC